MEGFDEGKAIELIYAAMLGEAAWQDFMRYLANSAANGKTVLVLHDEAMQRGYIPIAHGVESSTLNDYAAYYASVNPFMSPASAMMPGRGTPDIELINEKALKATEFYNDFLLPHEMSGRVSMTIEHSHQCMFVLALLSDALDIDEKHQVAQRLTRLAPHLQRASRFYREAGPGFILGDFNGAIFDAINKGVVVIGEYMHVKAMSKKAEQLIEGSEVVGFTALGRLRFKSPDIQESLRGMLDRWYMGNKLVTHYVEKIKVSLVLIEKNDISNYFEGPTVVAILEETQGMKKDFDIAHFSSCYGLTRAETRSLQGIANGYSVSEIAQQARRSEETVRTQIKSLYRKTRTNSREGIIRKLFGAS
ncbi:helix-turn-helix transcriptional regulator [Halomonas sabkhae]|uniref:helix-turn-helix transcriptional regulator n=1 Tax=Halomonas sabkhae TaxID=626223 RepID=UPI0025B3136C|nr:helix-turn-helix transcriptional regulator [Halomonas sabkhae]MDN3525912.1 helix-turn-helix transcriptional regulator [Halomonas sabkhae]